MTASFGSLKAPVAAELARQIEILEPNARGLVAHGFAWVVATAITKSIATGLVDLGEWRALGLSQQTAVEIANAISARHARVAAALSRVPAVPVPRSERIGTLNALNLLHTLSEQIQLGRGCPTELHRAGFSESTSEELARIINQTKEGN